MRMAYFVWEYPPRLVGGLGTYAAYITNKFAEMGHEVEVFTMNSDSQLKTYEEKNGVFIHRPVVADASNIIPVFVDEELKKWGKGLRFFSDILTYNFLSANKLINEVSKKKRFDIIVAHDWLSAIGGTISKRNMDIPFVFHVHSTEHGRSGGGGSKTVRELEYQTAVQADMIITVSYAMREELHFLKFPSIKTRVMWNGVDEKEFDPERFSPDKVEEFKKTLGVGNSRMILFTGRLTYVKGIDSLLRALPLILPKHPDTKLVILGRGEMYDELNTIAKQLNISNNVIFVNRWVSDEEKVLLYAAANIVCAPSRYEPFGIISLESMAMKTPVVVGSGGLREAVIDGQQGFYCDPNDPEDIANKLNRILGDEKLAREMGEKGRKRVLKLFTWSKIAKDTVELYETLL